MLNFAEFTIDPDRFSICRSQQPLDAPPQLVEVLTYLIEHSERVVSRQELLERFWPRAGTGGDAALNTCIRRIRALLEDDADVPRFIQTRPRAGYRFIGGPVSRIATEADAVPALEAPSPLRNRFLPRIALAGLALAMVVAAAMAWSLMQFDRQHHLIAVEPPMGLCEYVLFPQFNAGLRESFLAQVSNALPAGYSVTDNAVQADLHARISVRQTPEQTVVVLTLVDQSSQRSLWSREFTATTDTNNYVPLQQHLAEQMAGELAKGLQR